MKKLFYYLLRLLFAPLPLYKPELWYFNPETGKFEWMTCEKIRRTLTEIDVDENGFYIASMRGKLRPGKYTTKVAAKHSYLFSDEELIQIMKDKKLEPITEKDFEVFMMRLFDD